MHCNKKEGIEERAPLPYVEAQLNRLAPVALSCDISRLSDGDRACLEKLIAAARLTDDLFLRQVSPQNPAMLAELRQMKEPGASPYLALFEIMFGPWNRIDADAPFINKAHKPAGAGYYPPDMSREEFETALRENPDSAAVFTSSFTLLRRNDRGGLSAAPYHEAYRPLPQQVSALLDEAAALTNDTTLKRYLTLRARAFLTDDYFDSDMAWMDLAGDLEVVIGPYEVYEDNLFNYKAAYEAFLCVVDHAESDKLAAVAGHLDELESSLPIPDHYKNRSRGMSSPIKVVNLVFSAGDTKAGVQTTAFNLPNDERVREAKGSKKVMLKNVAQAKFEKCWIPIAERILAPRPLQHVTFDAYFNHVLMHEVSHGLGPGGITLADGEKIDAAKALKELYTVIEECKADVLGILTMRLLMDKGVFSKSDEYSMYASYAGGMLRSIRFGIGQAHGGAVAMQFNYCVEKGAFTTDAEGRLDIDENKMIPALAELANRILLLQARGDYEGAREFVAQYRVMTPLIRRYVDMCADAPVDIRPHYPLAASGGL